MEYTTVTDDGGRYRFVKLPAGPFHVRSVPGGLPEGVGNHVDPDGADDGRAGFDLPPGVTPGDVDFGYVGTNTIGDRVFSDLDGDGTPDRDEPGSRVPG